MMSVVGDVGGIQEVAGKVNEKLARAVGTV